MTEAYFSAGLESSAAAAREARRVRDAKHQRAAVAAAYEWDQARQDPDVLHEKDSVVAVSQTLDIALANTSEPAVRDRIRGIAEQKMRKAKVQAERLARRLLKSRGRDISATAILDLSRSEERIRSNRRSGREKQRQKKAEKRREEKAATEAEQQRVEKLVLQLWKADEYDYPAQIAAVLWNEYNIAADSGQVRRILKKRGLL